MNKAITTYLLLLLSFVLGFAQNQKNVNGCDASGYILAKGNSIFVPTDSYDEFEKEGQLKLKSLLSHWGYWKIVETIDSACCVIQYVNYTKATPDVAFVVIRHQDFYLQRPYITSDYSVPYYGVYMGSVDSGETIEENVLAANIFFNRIKTITSDESSKVYSIFHKGNDKALNLYSDEKTKNKTIIINYPKFNL